MTRAIDNIVNGVRGAKVAGVYMGHYHVNWESCRTSHALRLRSYPCKDSKVIRVTFPLKPPKLFIPHYPKDLFAKELDYIRSLLAGDRKGDIPVLVMYEGEIYHLEGVSPLYQDVILYVSLKHLRPVPCLEMLGDQLPYPRLLAELLLKPAAMLDHIYKVFEDGIEPYIYKKDDSFPYKYRVVDINLPHEKFIITAEEIFPKEGCNGD